MMTAPTTTAAAEPRPEYERPVISASRLKTIGGEKGAPGCERKTAGHYLFGMKQSSSTALEFGSALHTMAEHYQAAGEISEPESDVGRVLSAGAHLLTTCGPMLVEHEHVGTLPDGSPYVAYIDGHSDGRSATATVVIQDLKTTSNQRYALVGDEDPEGDPDLGASAEYRLNEDLQAMFYAWILLCDRHQFRAGPDAPWQTWDPAALGAPNGPGGAAGGLKSARLRWIYFLTKGVPRAWDATDWTTPEAAQAFMANTILPLVQKINNLHQWHYANPDATLDQFDRTLTACSNRGRWCGVGERDACNFASLGTPINDLIQLKVRKMTTPQERLAALRAKNAAGGGAALIAAAPAAQPAPVQEAPAASPPVPTPTTEAVTALSAPPVDTTPASTAAAIADSVKDVAPAAPSAELTRGQKAAQTRAANRAAQGAGAPPPAAPPVVGNINPPEVVEALAKLTAVQPQVAAPVASAASAATPVPAPEVCPEADELAGLINALLARVPVGVSITFVGQR
jgi:hypothetical protein